METSLHRNSENSSDAFELDTASINRECEFVMIYVMEECEIFARVLRSARCLEFGIHEIVACASKTTA